MMRVPREFRCLVKAAVEQGWAPPYSDGGGHLRMAPPPDRPETKPITLPSSPTRDRRAFLNARAVCRRSGVKI
jgi:hypothetical protein